MFLGNIYNIYAFCSGSGWQTISQYVDSLFGLQVFSRLIPENTSAINAVHYRGFTGSVAAQTTNYRKKARSSEIIDFGQLCQDISGQISIDKVSESLGIDESSKKRKNIGANFKNSFRLRKSLNLNDFCLLLDKINHLLNIEPYFCVEDWLGIKPLGESSREKTLKKELMEETLNRIYDFSIDKSKKPLDLFISYSNISLYNAADIYILSIGKTEKPFEQFSGDDHIRSYVSYLIEDYNNTEDDVDNLKSYVIEKLKVSVINSYSDGVKNFPLTTGKLTTHLQYDLVYENRNYLLLDGKWYIIS